MATVFSLKFWLKSLELEQYLDLFQEHHITTHQQCLHLNEQTLNEIGVAAVGHQRRILNHLPKDYLPDNDPSKSEAATNVAFQNPLNQKIQPVLPKKEKKAQDSFLFKDDQPIYVNDDDLVKKNEPDYINFDKSGTPKPAPRPVPRPRKSKPKKEGSDENMKQESVNRPTPAPRSTSITTTPTSEANTSTVNLNDGVFKFDIVGACVSESSTEDDFAMLYSKPIKNTDKLPSPCLNEDIQGKTPEFDTVYISGDEASLNSLDETLNSNAGSRDTKFENAEFDPLSGAYTVKFADVQQDTKQGNETFSGVNSTPSGANKSHLQQSNVKDTSGSVENTETEESDIYEPIWGDKKENKKEKSVKAKISVERKSNLMDFSPFPKATEFDFSKQEPETAAPVNKRLSMLNQSGTRDSASFDLPPPRFPPPPLPKAAAVDETVLADFDPLSTPVIPPRPPENSAPSKFQAYENIPLRVSSAESPTLPPQLNEEPDFYETETLPVRPPVDSNISQSTAVHKDIFKDVDPFGDFKPTDPDTDFDASMLASPFKTPKKKKTEPAKFDFGKTSEDTSSTAGEAVYEAVDEDFDPFGLNKETVSRKISNTSSGSNKGLLEVVPAPNWAEITAVDRTYSFAGEMGK